MKVLIPTMGTRGDIQPYIALAGELDRSGFSTVIATHPCWKRLVEEYNIEFHPVGPDIDIEFESSRIRGDSKYWITGMVKTMKFMFRIIKQSSSEIDALCQEVDLVIASHSHIGAAEAEARGVPFVSVTLQPEAIPEKLAPVSGFEAFIKKAVGAVINPFMVRPYNGLRKELGLDPVNTFAELISPDLNIIPVSPAVYPPKRYWEEQNRVVGYWFLEGNEDYRPPDRVKDFLESGDSPVIISLGAMGFESESEQKKLDQLVKSINKRGMRAVIQGFNRSLKNYRLPDNIISLGSVPHDWLFQNAYCVIHHGGFGTTAAVLKAGVPSIVIPHVLDQNFWADRVFKLQAGPEPLKSKDLNEQSLGDRLKTVADNYQAFHKNAGLLSEKINQENGLQKTVGLIKGVIG